MTAKQFLLRVQRAEHELKLIAEKRRHFTDLAMAIGANMGKAVITKPSCVSKTETAAVGLVYLKQKLDKKEQEYTALVDKAEEMIDQLPQDNFRAVLTYKYLCGNSWKTIRDKMGYKDEKSAIRCNGYALSALQGLMNEEEQNAGAQQD